MKHFLFFVTFLMISNISFGQCPLTPITLATQAEVDAFTTNFPGCSMLQNNLTISGSDILNLDGLSQVVSINGDMMILDNPILSNLNGLNNLTRIEGGGGLYIQNNNSLIDLNGLDNIEELKRLNIIDNDALQNLSGFGVFGLNGAISIQNNINLVSLSGLEEVEELYDINISNNPSLIDVSAIEYINFFPGFGELIITQNPNLSSCSLTSFCNFMNDGGIVTINNNNTGCESIPEVQSTCPVCPTSDITLATQAEVDAFATMYPNCTELDVGLTVEGNDITNLMGLSQLVRSNNYFSVRNNPNLISLSGLENFKYCLQTFSIINNPLLTNLNGLGTFTRVGPYVSGNENLQSLEGLNLTSAYVGSVYVSNNPNLTSISALEEIQTYSPYMSVTITYNSLLTECDIALVCHLINEQQTSDLTISNNGPGCETYEEVYEDCTGCPYGIVELNSQAEVDAFGASYPACTFTTSTLIVEGADIVDLTPLQNLQSLGTGLIVRNNPLLTTIDGLNSLNDLGSILIENNDLLTDVSALSNISSVGNVDIFSNASLETISGWNMTSIDYLNIWANPLLVSLEGFENTETISSGLTINENTSLENLNGLNGLTTAIVLSIKIEENESLIDLTGLSGLQNTELNSLIISQNNSLENLNGLEGIIEVYQLHIDTNPQLQNLDALSNLVGPTNSIKILFNDTLEDISGLEFIDPQILDNVDIEYNLNLSECSILSFCNAFQNENTDFHFFTNAIGCNSLEEVEENCDTSLNTFYGKVTYDFDNNGCEEDDYPSSNLIVRAANTESQTTSTVTNMLGEYILQVPEGEFTIEILPEQINNNYVSSPLNETINFIGAGNFEEVDFCLSAVEVFDDLKITIIPTNDARPGFDSYYRVIYENLGATVLSGEITLQFDEERQQFLEAIPSEASINGNTITWNYSDLLPFQSRIIDITFNNFQPPINESGDILSFTATIPIVNDANPEDNEYLLEQEIINSQDPNDKIVNQGAEIFEAEVGDYLDYIVRFQNVGTASAINVRIEDVLSENLDWSTFRILSASHEYRVEIMEGNEVFFIFDDIYLPSVNDDPEGSNGFVAFQLKTKNSLQVGDTVENEANIFFDFNAPILTNKVITEVVENLEVSEINLDINVVLFPNPVSETLTIYLLENIQLEEVQVYTFEGKNLLKTSEVEIDFSKYSSGVYFVKVKTDRGTTTKKIVKQ